ncbi:23S rRNA (adenine(1618)-N(6))-methyltransferase RlmF [Winogradskyella sediminis]|uniref:Ribosomal RNA large subunit methyltransferase F n=1 Tax=Winogradskyella sediminis TaxID=1382466 RepID=A0A1H1V518_9FLAO|nr:23S rRNA (adenine(1618)-N(6))-methyltransferase RlmF [Winogradskyella sediminis]REG87623.1 23S rRNA m(6)A-1618 methyltransferase [Winogradskyella sediminis]SDS79838.1 23S rRNA m(6)A-1618 methyltransferase [Winogradskyella sediminis]
MEKKKQHPKVKSELHPRNQHRSRYDFKALIKSSPELGKYVAPNTYGDDSVDFFNPAAVKALNKALLIHHYGLDYWDIPEHYLCPPIPGRADYIHNIADLLKGTGLEIPKGKHIKGLDIGVGANCIYPIIGQHEYGWSFIGSDTDEIAIISAKTIEQKNYKLRSTLEIRRQEKANNFFYDILKPEEKVDFTICNPPFHASAADAQKASLKKQKNLKGKRPNKSLLNFGGQHNELWTKGGEARFVKDMIYESKHFGKQCLWFTSLISKEATLKPTYKILEKVNATDVKTIEMGQGHKISRFIAWTFLTEQEQKDWKAERW